ncbi:hypothetical protein SUGI_0456350 [Cryptomeria japonica]|nr:hypothetical protein SUGI_0456350 [Cryptomeria japonica]
MPLDGSKELNTLEALSTLDVLEVDVLDELMNVAEINLSLVVKLLAFRPSIDQVRSWVDSLWKLKGSVKIGSMANGIFLFSFVSQEDIVKVLMTGPSIFGSYRNFLSLTKWKLGFDPCLPLEFRN